MKKQVTVQDTVVLFLLDVEPSSVEASQTESVEDGSSKSDYNYIIHFESSPPLSFYLLSGN